ncbi:MAG: hypothetical protein N2484_17705 [Clostridia bacterium]|nr:hypothetical protein [Clostridia bacterium]
MRSLLSNNALNDYSHNLTQELTPPTEPVFSAEEYQRLQSAIRPIFELISNGLFSDALKSIKVKKDQLLCLPDILEKLYLSNINLLVKPAITPASPTIENSSSESAFEKSELYRSVPKKAVKNNIISLNTSLSSVISTSSENKGHSFIFSGNSDDIHGEFTPFQLNKTACSLRHIIYFKEYSYPLYFNTFLKYLVEVLSQQFKTRLVIFEQISSRLNLKRYDDLFLTDIPSINAKTQLEGRNKLVLFHPSEEIMQEVCSNQEGYEILVIYDKCGFEKDFVTGFKVRKFDLVKSASDVQLFKLTSNDCISSGIKELALDLTSLPKFKEIKHEGIRMKLYKKLLIDPFLNTCKIFTQPDKTIQQEEIQ